MEGLRTRIKERFQALLYRHPSSWTKFLSIALVGLLVFPHDAHAGFFIPLLVGMVLAGTTAVALPGVAAKVADLTLGSLLEFVAQMFYSIANMFAVFTAWALDWSIVITINSGVYNQLRVIDVGWTTVRDLCNMFFIFILLYIAIRTILQMEGGTKRLLVNVIIAALLINFSLFFSKIIIDAANIFAVGFWSKIEITDGSQGVKNSVGRGLIAALDLQTISVTKDATGKECASGPTENAIRYFGGGILMLIAGYIFLAGAFMMIYRSVVLILCLIFSPLAFLGPILPKFGGEGNAVMEQLIKASVLAPAYIFMLYLVTIAVSSGIAPGETDLEVLAYSKDQNLGCALIGDGPNFGAIYSFVVQIFLMLSALIVAQKISGGIASFGTSWAKKSSGFIAGGLFTSTALAGRKLGGKAGDRLQRSDRVQKLAQRTDTTGRMARRALAMAEAARTSTYDPRNTRAGSAVLGATLGKAGINAGQGTKRTFAQTGGLGVVGDDKIERVTKDAERLYPNNPEAREQYVNDKLGKGFWIGKNNLKAGPGGDISGAAAKQLKSAKEKTDNEIRLNETKKEVADKLEKFLNMSPEDRAKTDQITGRTIGEEIARTLTKLNGTNFTDLLKSEKYSGDENAAKRAALYEHMNGSHLSSTLKEAGEGKIDSGEIEVMTERVMQSGTPAAQRTLQSQFKLGNANLERNIEKDIEERTKERNIAIAAAAGDVAAENRAREEHRNKVTELLRYQTMDDVAKYKIENLREIAPNLNKDQRKALNRKTIETLDAEEAAEAKKAADAKEATEKSAASAAQAAAAKKLADEKTKKEASDSARFRELLAKLTLTDAEKAELEALRNAKS